MRRRWWWWTGGATKGVVSDGGRCVGMAPEPGEAGEGGGFGVGDWINSTGICGKYMPPPKPDITIQKAIQHLVDYQQTHMGSAQF